MQAKTLVQAKFRMDALSIVYEGFTFGENWNGWACPYFELSLAEEVLRASEENGYLWTFRPEQDQFEVKNAEDPADYEPEVFRGRAVEFEGQHLILYPIGAHSWIWEQCEKE